MWEGRAVCPRLLGESTDAPPCEPAVPVVSPMEGEVAGSGAPAPPCAKGTQVGTRHGPGSRVILLEEIRPAGAHHRLGLCCGGVALCQGTGVY